MSQPLVHAARIDFRLPKDEYNNFINQVTGRKRSLIVRALIRLYCNGKIKKEVDDYLKKYAF